MAPTTGTVLVVDDREEIADAYAAYLGEDYEVRVAYGGEDALEHLDAADVVLLDRQMPGQSGDAVLERIHEQDLPCRVALVTAVEPDFDIVDLRFDEYLVKPVFEDELKRTVERLMARTTYREKLRELYALASKRSILVQQRSEHELDGSDAFARLNARIDRLRDELDETTEEMTPGDAFDAALVGGSEH